MHLTDDEKAVLDGSEGIARQKAMELIVRYGEALDAERLVDTNNVCVSVTASRFSIGEKSGDVDDVDTVISRFYLDSDVAFEIPMAKAYTCRLIREMDPDKWNIQGIEPHIHDLNLKTQAVCSRIGMQPMHTCFQSCLLTSFFDFVIHFLLCFRNNLLYPTRVYPSISYKFFQRKPGNFSSHRVES